MVGGTTDTYAFSPTANQISTITTGANVRSFSYLASGQVSQDVRDSSHTYAFTANNNGRNASASLNGSTAGTYVYNGLEQRAQKAAGGSTTQFVYDLTGHLLQELNSSGVIQREYIWLDNLPVAMVDDTGASPVLYFIHSDQLGTPQKITDATPHNWAAFNWGAFNWGYTTNVVWDGVSDPFGNPASGSSLALTNLRFPGQYADAETALNQNWNRDYDPTTGRYIQSDPVGLGGGINTYGYVGGESVWLFRPNWPMPDLYRNRCWRNYGCRHRSNS